MGGRGVDTEGLRAAMARGRPNWWVILAVSLALMALLVATSGGGRSAPTHKGGLSSSAPTAASRRAGGGAGPGATPGARPGPRHGASSAPTTTTTTAAGASSSGPPSPSSSLGGVTAGTSSLAAHAGSTDGAPPPASTPPPSPPSVATTTTTAPTTTTTAGPAPADRTQAEGYLDPPVVTSHQYGFTGTGAMQVAVVWSGSTYLTMTVSCPNGTQNVGGTAAMAANLPDATGSCLATVSEPSSETASLTYTVTIGPAGG